MNLIYKKDHRHGFTLMELLLVISILAVLSTMALAVMASATDDAKAAATQSRITKIEAILQTELERYEVRRLPISLSDLKSLAGTNSLIVVRDLKRQIIADLLNAEMPRPDIDPMTLQPILSEGMGEFPSLTISVGATESFNDWLLTNYSGLHTELTNPRYDSSGVLYWRKFNPMPGVSGTGDEQFNNFGEYLYAILNRIDIDGTSGVEALGNAAIGNSDENDDPVMPDPYLEVVDAWGNPLQLRILQVGIDGAGIDLPTNWNNLDPTTGIPEGYEILNPAIARPLDKIRFQVVSPRLIGIAQ